MLFSFFVFIVFIGVGVAKIVESFDFVPDALPRVALCAPMICNGAVVAVVAAVTAAAAAATAATAATATTTSATTTTVALFVAFLLITGVALFLLRNCSLPPPNVFHYTDLCGEEVDSVFVQ